MRSQGTEIHNLGARHTEPRGRKCRSRGVQNSEQRPLQRTKTCAVSLKGFGQDWQGPRADGVRGGGNLSPKGINTRKTTQDRQGLANLENLVLKLYAIFILGQTV